VNTALVLAYAGENYHGWQRQLGHATIQELMERALKKIWHETHISGCGRTDSGVHANVYCASFKGLSSVPLERLPFALNSHLPPDIAVFSALAMDDDFDARFSCRAKEYTYFVRTMPGREPFSVRRSYQLPRKLDISAMAEAASFIEGTHDFTALKNEGSPRKTNVRTVFYCNVYETPDGVAVRVGADGFLYNMVRNIAGTLVYAGLGKLSPEDVGTLIEERRRDMAGPTLPPEGLFLTGLTYEKEALDACINAAKARRPL